MASQNKNGKIQIFAKNIKGISHGQILEESKRTQNIAGEKHIQNGENGGVNNGNNQDRKPTEETEVKTIECVDELDEGSANDGSGVNTKGGIIFGKTYTFKVKEYTKDTPKNLSNIRWALSYTSPETGIYYENILSRDIRGETIRISFAENTNICGCEMEIKAYISNISKEGNLKVWHHNRFRWFDGENLKTGINARKTTAWLVNQKDTNTCGPSAIMYVFAKRNKENYGNFIQNLHRKGYAKFNGYEIDINSNGDLEDIANTNPNNSNDFPKLMDSCDWIPNICITDNENIIFDYEGNTNEDFSAITLPSRLKMLNEKLLGFTDVIDNTNLYFNKTSWAWGTTLEDIAELIKAKEEGYEVYLLIGINMLYNKTSTSAFSTAEHWIVLESIEHGEMGYVKLHLYTWGQNPNVKEYNISYDIFRTNYYGYIKAK